MLCLQAGLVAQGSNVLGVGPCDTCLSSFLQQGTYYTQPLYAAPPHVIHHTTVVQPNGMPATVYPAPIPPPRGNGVTMGMVAGTTMAMSAGESSVLGYLLSFPIVGVGEGRAHWCSDPGVHFSWPDGSQRTSDSLGKVQLVIFFFTSPPSPSLFLPVETGAWGFEP